ncbi:bacillithiol biosynthesis cysteine-adding enzyme BshC [Rurimicrobium arvi]|uniref:Putative cysteine ligase BshC n=1 Tax=Rurimicrobium arvi TaxID=2049916 RepID=A0ABP8MLJ2_9BACT
MAIKSYYVPYTETHSFSGLVNDYINREETLRDFYRFSPDASGVEAAILERPHYPVDRQTLVQVLEDQYRQLPILDTVSANIRSLADETTFTVCTAHQPNLLGGYLYFFYKILYAVRIAEELNGKHPGKHFVPVYYMGSEDNDLDELGRFLYNGNQYIWDAAGQTGAVGRMATESLATLLNEFFHRIGPPGWNKETLQELLTEAYLGHKTIGEATRYWVHRLFGPYGLVVLDPDDARLKARFVSVMKDDLLGHTAASIVADTNRKLEQHYKAQAFVRPVNLFYLRDNIRERIEHADGRYHVLNTGISFTEAEILEELSSFPDRFSPNVILRGMYQESILPDVCFVGGGSEVAYWLQLMPLFEHYRVFFPQVMLRQSVQLIQPEAARLLEKLDLQPTDIFEDPVSRMKEWVRRQYHTDELLQPERETMRQLLQSLTGKAVQADTTLEKAVAASGAKIRKQLDRIDKKITSAYLKKEEVTRERLLRLREWTHPGGGLQERTENFSTYFLMQGFSIFEEIKNAIKPFANEFLIVVPDL